MSVHPSTYKARHEQGTALVTVMLIFFVASFLTGEMFNRLNVDIRRTTTLLAQDQAYLYVLSAEELAFRVLRDDLKEDKKENDNSAQAVDHPEEEWYGKKVSYPLEGGGISATLVDLQGRLNLNDLRNNTADSRARIKQLLTDLNLLESSNQVEVIESLVEWMDKDDIPASSGAEDLYYTALEKPYRTANTYFSSVSELNLIKGLSLADIIQLKPYVSVLPEGVRTNINTVSEPVLNTFQKGESLKSIIEDRPKDGYTSVAEAFKKLKKPPKQSQFSVHSEYFLLEAVAVIQERKAVLRSIIYRPTQPDESNTMRVILRDRARLFAPLKTKKEETGV